MSIETIFTAKKEHLRDLNILQMPKISLGNCNELFGDKISLKRENLGERIKACLDVDGTYTLVCTGIHLNKSNKVEKKREF